MKGRSDRSSSGLDLSSRPPPVARVDALVRELIDSVSTGNPGAHASELLLDVVIDGVRCTLVPAPDVDEHVYLSPREREIARMVAQGYPNKTIAAVLDISTWTVATHLRRIFAKLGVRSRAAMVAELAQDGLIQREPERRGELLPPSGSRGIR